ncbi:MAG: hypothetical protein IJ174_07510, partial [Clostridia bacterium]|nr:hypothetical protein [Clostridia bacterium]
MIGLLIVPVRQTFKRMLSGFASEIMIRLIPFRTPHRQILRSVSKAPQQRNIIKIPCVAMQDPIRLFFQEHDPVQVFHKHIHPGTALQ